MTKVGGASWAVEVTYACRCGAHYRATRWRWIDREAAPDEADRARQEGPVRGRCPSCGAPAAVRCEWLELEPSRERACLILAANQRHQLVELLRDHFQAIHARVRDGALVAARPWLLRPTWRFEDEGTAVLAVSDIEIADEHDELTEDTPVKSPANSGVPKAVGFPRMSSDPATEAADTYVAMLSLDRTSQEGEDVVSIDLELDEAGRSLWGQAALQVRPIHLRTHGYPLIGVRLVASYLGRMSLIDAVVDVGSEEAGAIFASLSRRFRVQLVLAGEGSSVVRREVSARKLERNAALCLESARASLARSEYPVDGFHQAIETLRGTPLEERLRGADHSLVAGAYRHLISPRETWVALEHLESASEKQNLAKLLEVDGLSVDEYEGIRRRVLEASVEHGVCAPRRFWRRIIASGLAEDFDDYAAKLAHVRAQAEQDGDDFDQEQRSAAWARIAELCDLKQLEYPVELARKLGLDVSDRPRRRSRLDSGRERRSAAGEITARPAGGGGGSLRDQLRDPELRLRVATAALANGGSPEAVEAVFEVLDDMSEEELLALMPSLAEIGTQAVPALHAKLESPRQQVRQAAAILLGIARDSSSIVPLLRRLAREPSRSITASSCRAWAGPWPRSSSPTAGPTASPGTRSRPSGSRRRRTSRSQRVALLLHSTT